MSTGTDITHRESPPGGPLPLRTLYDLSRDEADDAILVVQGGTTRPPVRVQLTPLDADAKALVVLVTQRTGRPLSAGEALGYDPKAVQEALKGDSDFASAIQAARALRVEVMEAAADRRAFDGIEETRIDKDGNMTTKLVFSDKLAELRLKAEDPAKYTERKHLSVDARAAVLVVPAPALSTDEWRASVGASD